MIAKPHHILLRPRGRIGRPSFVAGVVALVALSTLATVVMRALDPGTAAGFWFGLAAWFVLLPLMLCSVFVQRLHDMGRTAWPFTALIAGVMLILIGVMLAHGGAEYFNAFSQFERKEAIDPDVVAQLQADYRAEMANAGQPLSLILSVVLGGFTLWLALARGQGEPNAYGPPTG